MSTTHIEKLVVDERPVRHGRYRPLQPRIVHETIAVLRNGTSMRLLPSWGPDRATAEEVTKRLGLLVHLPVDIRPRPPVGAEEATLAWAVAEREYRASYRKGIETVAASVCLFLITQGIVARVNLLHESQWAFAGKVVAFTGRCEFLWKEATATSRTKIADCSEAGIKRKVVSKEMEVDYIDLSPQSRTATLFVRSHLSIAVGDPLPIVDWPDASPRYRIPTPQANLLFRQGLGWFGSYVLAWIVGYWIYAIRNKQAQVAAALVPIKS
jgi:hypothetical protein